ncbi:VCBS domain-containing protein [Synechococcus sp. Cu2B8-bc1011]|uniref:VCBS domain-containing protein n=1 Tax=Synechococcus sp. Cu2B8-bc1011 TaxID=3093725 RepID=UPI0039AEA6AD
MPENVNSIDRSILLEELEAAGVIDAGDVLTSTRDQEITANQRNRLKGGDGDDHYIGEDGKKETFIFDGRNDNRDEGRHVNVISHFSFHDQDRLRIRLDGGFFQTDDGNNLAQSSDGDQAYFQTARDIADLLLHINRKDGIKEGIGEDLTISPVEIVQQTREKNGKVKGQFRRELKQQQIEGSYVEIVGNHLVINLDDGDGSGETVDKWGNYKTNDVMLVYENFNEQLASQLASEFDFDAADFTANAGSIKIEGDSGDVLSSGFDDAVFILGNAASTIRINSEQDGGNNPKKINIIYGFDLDADTVIIDNNANYFIGIEGNSFKEFVGKDGIGELIAAASSFEQTGSDLVVELQSEGEESIVIVFANTDINDITNGGIENIADNVEISSSEGNLLDIEGLSLNDEQFQDENGELIDPAAPPNAEENGALYIQATPIALTINPDEASSDLEDANPARDGTQVVVEINLTDATLNRNTVNSLRKFVSQSVLDDYQQAGLGDVLLDLNGEAITQAGWYDFTRKKDEQGNFIGDGAELVYGDNGILQTINLYLTDNQFGDNSININQINDPIVLGYEAEDTGFINEDETESIGGSLKPSDVEGSFSAQINSQGLYGSFSLDEAGQWSYSLDSEAAQSLTDGETVLDVFNAEGVVNGETVSETITITISGSNDGPVVNVEGSTLSGEVTEDGVDDQGNETPGNSTALGSVVLDDVGTEIWSIQGTPSTTYGTFELESNGDWKFTLNNASAATQALQQDEEVFESFTVRATDEFGAFVDQEITLKIRGANDGPVVNEEGSALSGEVTEDGVDDQGNETPGISSASGALLADDVDGATQTWSIQGTPSAAYGTFALDEFGAWSFTLDNASAATQALKEGEQVSETFSARVTDEFGASADQTITVTITGSNDGPVINTVASDLSGDVLEAGTTDDGTVIAGTSVVSGQLLATDLDADATQTWSIQGTPSAAYGTFALDEFGAWSFTLDNASAATQALKEGEQVSETFSARVIDEFGAYADQTITVTITGSNDGPVINTVASDLSGDVLEAGTEDDGTVIAGTSVVSGQLLATDLDADATQTWSIQGTPSAAYGTFSLDEFGAWGFTLDNASAATQALKEGEQVSETFNARVIDEFGAYADQTITVTITGSNDGPVINTVASDLSGDVLEAGTTDDGSVIAGTSVVSGQLLATDLDADATQTWSIQGTSSTSSGWATQAGGTGFDYGNSITALADGSSLITGRFEGSASFGETTLTSAGNNDVFVAKLNADGSYAWATQAGGISTDIGTSITALADGSSLITGYFQGSASFGETTLTTAGGNDVFVAKLNADGSYAWATQAGGTGFDYGNSITALADGSSLITGRFAGSASFGETTLTASGFDAFIAKLNADGSYAWATQAGGISTDIGTSITALADGSSLITGRFAGSASFGETTLTTAGGNDVFVAKLNADGSYAWATQAGGTSNDEGFGITALADGASLITGWFTGSASFGETTLTASGFDAFIAKLNADGSYAWATQAGGTSTDFGQSITALADGSSLITGRFFGNASFGDNTLTSAGLGDVFIAKLNADGSYAWATQAGGTGFDYGYSITALADGSSLITGYFQGSASFGDTTLTSAGGEDVFIAKLNADGSWGTITTMEEPSSAYGTFSLDEFGAWSFTLDNASAATQALKEGEQVSETFSARVTDEFGASADQTITVTITGSNDAPVINTVASDLSGDVLEAGTTDDGTVIAGTSVVSGQLLATDLDADATQTWSIQGTPSAAYGTFALDEFGAWSFTLDNASAATQALKEGEQVSETFSARVTDEFGASADQTITVTITGSNDGPVINTVASDLSGDVLEAGTTDDGTVIAGTSVVSGQLLATDLDADATQTWSIQGTPSAAYGTFALDEFGAWSFTLDNASAATQALKEGEQVSETFSARVIDEFGAYADQTITVTITGSNDGPVINTVASDLSGDVLEAGTEDDGTVIAGTSVVSGQLLATDLDADATQTWSIQGTPSTSSGWVTQAGGTANDEGRSITALADGSSLITGSFQGSASFGDTTLTSAGNNDVFVAKLNADGNYAWATQAGGTSNDEGFGITALADGSSLITGYFQGSASFGDTTLTSTGSADVFIAKLNADGSYAWVSQAGGAFSNNVRSITALADGSSLITGYFLGSASFGVTTLTSAGSNDVFVAKLNADGSYAWATRAGGSSTDFDLAVAESITGLTDRSSLITGRFFGSASFGDTTLTSTGSADVFIAKLNADGSYAWATQAGGTSNDEGRSITALADGSSLITGYFQGSANFGDTTLTSTGSNDVFIAKLNADGSYAWATQAGGTSGDYGTSITALADGSSLITGRFSGSASFGETTLTSAGSFDVFIAKLNADGSYAWATQAGGQASDYGFGITALADGSSLITGRFEGSASFGETTLTSTGGVDVFVAKLNADGSWGTITTMEEPSSAYGTFALDEFGEWSFTLDNASAATQALKEGEQVSETFNARVIDEFGASADQTITVTITGSNDGPVINTVASDLSGDVLEAGTTDDGTVIAGTSVVSGQLLATDLDADATQTWSIQGTSSTSSGWATQAGGTSDDEGRSITALADGSSLITGRFSGSASFGDTILTTSGQFDRDVFVAKLNADGSYAWATQAGGSSTTGVDEGTSITALADGSSLIIGRFTGSASFGDTTLTYDGNSGDSSIPDVFIAKLNADGSYAWATQAGGSSFDQGFGITALADGSSLITGAFGGSATFGDTTLTSAGGTDTDVFVAKLDAQGQFLWATQAGGAAGSGDRGTSIAALADGSSLITGWITGSSGGSASFGDITLNFSANSSNDVFIAKLDDQGQFLWATQAGGTSTDIGFGITALADGSSLITGQFQDSASFGDISLTAAGGTDVFITKLNADGSYTWATQAGGSSFDQGFGITALADGSSLITGRFFGNASFGDISLTAAGSNDVFIAKLNADGSYAWATQAGGQASDYGFGITALADGSSLITGRFEGSASFGETTLTSTGGVDVFVAKLNADGSWGTITTMEEPSSAYGTFALDEFGAWSFTLDNASAATQALKEGEQVSETFSARVIDEFGAYADQTITVTITGSNDGPVINTVASDLSGDVIEAGTTDDGSVIAGTSVVSGQLLATDLDADATQTWSIQGTPSAAYGTFSLDEFGAWSFTLDNASAATQALKEGEQVSETFSARVTDEFGASADQTITVTITGSNDAPTVTEAIDVTGAVTELAELDVNEGSAALTDSGSFAIADVDLSDVQSVSVTASTTTSTETAETSTTLGSLTATVSDNTTADGTGAVSWTYSVADSAVDYLAAGQTISETFTITVADGNGGNASQDVTVTVTGTNDQPVAAAVAINATEDGPTVIGNFTETDADSTDSHTFAIGSWTQIGDDIDGEAAADRSGYSVSLSGDGNVVAIGAPFNDGNGSSSGQVRLYRNTGDSWAQIGDDIDAEAAGDQSGTSVALSGDGSIVAIGAPLNDPVGNASGHVRLYRNTGDSWTQIGEDIDGEVPSEQSGFSVSLSENGNVVAIGARWRSSRSGQVRLYQLENDSWTQLGDDIDEAAAGDESGTSVSLSADGSVVAIGAPFNDDNGNNSGQVRLYQLENDSWTQIGDDIDGEAAGDESGTSLALSADGSVVAIGAPNNDGNNASSGQVRLYRNTGGSWTQIGEDIDGEKANDYSGWSVSLSADGNVVAIGANKNDGNGGNSGHVRLYQNVNDSWTQIGADIDGEAALDESGWSVSLSADGSVVAIGARFNDGNGSSSGQVRMYQLEGLNITGEPAEGSIVNNNDGTFSFDPGSDFQDLAEGETRDVTFTYTATDDSGAGNATSDPATATITVSGSNDAPVINPGGSDLTGEVTEDGVDDQGNETPGISSASGALLADDVDGATQTWSILDNTVESYGTFELENNGDWKFTLDNESEATQALWQDDFAVETVTVRATDEFGAFVDQEIEFFFNGSNDGPVVNVDNSTLSGEVTEAGVDDFGEQMPGISSALGFLIAEDVDGATQTWSILGTPSETYGTFELDEFGFGDWTFTLDNESAATQALQQDEEVVELFSVRATDEFGAFVDQEISITIRGANDDDSTDPDDSTPLEPIMVGDIGNDALIGIDDEEEFFGGGGDNLLNLPQNFTDFV